MKCAANKEHTVETPVKLNGKTYCSHYCCGLDNGGVTPKEENKEIGHRVYHLPGNP